MDLDLVVNALSSRVDQKVLAGVLWIYWLQRAVTLRFVPVMMQMSAMLFPFCQVESRRLRCGRRG